MRVDYAARIQHQSDALFSSDGFRKFPPGMTDAATTEPHAHTLSSSELAMFRQAMDDARKIQLRASLSRARRRRMPSPRARGRISTLAGRHRRASSVGPVRRRGSRRNLTTSSASGSRGDPDPSDADEPPGGRLEEAFRAASAAAEQRANYRDALRRVAEADS
jgi:hypothetical protein